MLVEDPILRDCNIYCDITTRLARDIQSSPVASDVSPSSSYCNNAFHFVKDTYTHLLPFYSTCTWLLSLQLSTYGSADLTAMFDHLVYRGGILESSVLKWQRSDIMIDFCV